MEAGRIASGRTSTQGRSESVQRPRIGSRNRHRTINQGFRLLLGGCGVERRCEISRKNGKKLVSLTFARWNQIHGWLSRLEALRAAA
jgi:hypothetical protein